MKNHEQPYILDPHWNMISDKLYCRKKKFVAARMLGLPHALMDQIMCQDECRKDPDCVGISWFDNRVWYNKCLLCLDADLVYQRQNTANKFGRWGYYARPVQTGSC